MGKRWLIILTILLIAGSITGWYFFATESRYFGTSPLKAVPVESPYFIRVRDLGGFSSKTVLNSGWKSLKSIGFVGELYGNFVLLDSVSIQNKDIENFLRHRELVFAPLANSNLYILPINSIAEKNSIRNFFQDYFQSRNIQGTEDEFKDVQVQRYAWLKNGESRQICFAFYKGLLIASNDYALLCNSVEQADHLSVADDPGFRKIRNDATKNIDLNIYINHEFFPGYISKTVKDTLASAISCEDYARWTELDVIQKENQVFISGISVTDSISLSYLDVFKHQKPLTGSLLPFMPSVTSYFAIQNLSDVSAYFQDYTAYLEKLGKKERYDLLISTLSKDLNLDVRKYLAESWTGEAAAVFLNFNLENSSDNRFLLMKVKSGKTDLLAAALRKRMITHKSRFSDASMADSEKYSIHSLPADNFGQLLGEYCFVPLLTRYLTVYEDCIIMGVTPGSLRRYLDYLHREECLRKDASFEKFSNRTARASNYHLWSAPGHALPFFSPILDLTLYQSLQKDIPGIKKIEHVDWQWGYENGVIYNSGNIQYNSAAGQEQFPIWKYSLHADILKKPVMVSCSQNTPDKTILFQDRNNSLISLDKDGLENWRIRLDGPVLGEFKIVDISKKGEYHLLFNTKSAIHLVGRNGSEMKNFPIRLKSSATNEVVAVDFDGRKEYRFLVACRDRKIYNFDKYGKSVPGWQPKPSSGIVEQPVRHFRSGPRDYLVYFDKNRTYLVDRQGKERMRLREEFTHSGNNVYLLQDSNGKSHMITTDENGMIRILGFDGSSKKLSLGKYSAGHKFIPTQSPEVGGTKFLFVDQGKISLFDLSGRLIFSRPLALQGNISPSFITAGKEELIELYSATENKSVYFQLDGSEFNPGFPGLPDVLSLGSFVDTSRVANFLMHSKDNMLSNYQMILK